MKKIGLYWKRDPPQDKAMETVDQHREAYNALSQLHKDSVKAWTRIYGDDEWAIFAADVEKGIYITALTSNDRTKKRAAEPVAPASHFAMQEVDLEGSYSPMGSIMQDCNVEQWDRDYIGFLEDFQPTQGVPSSMVWEEGYAGTDHHVQGRPTCYSPITQAMNDQRCSAFYAHPPRRYD